VSPKFPTTKGVLDQRGRNREETGRNCEKGRGESNPYYADTIVREGTAELYSIVLCSTIVSDVGPLHGLFAGSTRGRLELVCPPLTDDLQVGDQWMLDTKAIREAVEPPESLH
jgi:hypothetical protein